MQQRVRLGVWLALLLLTGHQGSTAQQPAASGIIPGRFLAIIRPGCSVDPSDQAAAAAAGADTAPLLAAGLAYSAAAAASSLAGRFGDAVSVTHTFEAIAEGFAFSINPPAAAATAAPTPEAAAAAAAAAAAVAAPVLGALDADPCIALHPDRAFKMRGATNPLVAGNSVPTGVSRIAAATASRVNGPAAVGIAIMDEGVGAHPDLNIVLSIDCAGSTGGQCRQLPRPQGGAAGHATLVAGVAAARNGKEGGVVGVAPGSRIYSINVFANDDATTADVLAGLNWVRRFNAEVTDPGGRGKIRVINISFGSTSYIYKGTDGVSLVNNPAAFPACGAGMRTVDPWHTAICQLAIDKVNGAVAVVAVANEAADFDTGIPERYPEVIAVTAMADNDGKPGGSGFYCRGGAYVKPFFYLSGDSFSQFSNHITLPNPVAEAHTVAAPGSCITSTFKNASYATETGCSFAAPHVSAVVALCFGEATGRASNRARDGPCKAAFEQGGVPAVIRLVVESAAYRLTGAAGFPGDRDRPVSFACASGTCQKHYGYLISAASV